MQLRFVRQGFGLILVVAILMALFVGGVMASEKDESTSVVGSGDPVLRVGVFNVDVTPPIGSPLAYDTMTWVDKPLTARGVVICGDGYPVVLCAVDWIGIGNEGQSAWKQALAEAAGTTPQRVVVHTLHQHDAPVCDFSIYKILFEYGLHGNFMDPVFARQSIARCASGVQEAVRNARPVTHIGFGDGIVEDVASNRRLLGEDGKVRATRWTATADPDLRSAPVGIIDPRVSLMSFWDGENPVAVLTFYATHPQSYYRTGGASPDFPGLAREMRETHLQGVPHIHFAGAGGNIGAGKWNDGSPDNRIQLAIKLAKGMAQAWENIKKVPVAAADLDWATMEVPMPVAPHIQEKSMRAILGDEEQSGLARQNAAAHLAWLNRSAGSDREVIGHISRLRIGEASLLFLPGEAVVEYQLEARLAAGDQFVATAAYGDYGPGYICLTEHYAQGGYESSPGASRVAPEIQKEFFSAIRRLVGTSDSSQR